MHEVLDHVARLARAGFASDCTIVEDYDPSLPPVMANRDGMIQVVLNLVKNAADAGGRTITLHTGYDTTLRAAEGRYQRVAPFRSIERYSHVMHIVSGVAGELAPDRDAFDLFSAVFPAGTLVGAPKVRAMQIIDELEKEKRGLYAGSVGYFSAGGEMDSCIVLRTALIKDGTMYVQAGAGIVADSNPKSEQQECVDKAKALFRAAEEAKRFASVARRGQ
jgi:anthranilate synthase component 1